MKYFALFVAVLALALPGRRNCCAAISFRAAGRASATTPRQDNCASDADCGGALHGKCANQVCLCHAPFFGPQCQQLEPQAKCAPACQNDGYCDESDHKCKCRDGFTGSACQLKCPPGQRGNPCSGHGLCSFQGEAPDGINGETSTCLCANGWAGRLCQRQVCPMTAKGECNGSGRCVKGACQCYETFTGQACETRTCNTKCSGHGHCSIFTESCKCKAGWHGQHCEIKKCPKTRFGVCSGHGRCSDDAAGECLCDAAWTGRACHVQRCHASEHLGEMGCSGHGECRGHACSCEMGWGGAACQYRKCPLNCLSSRGRGECVSGVCKCAPGFAGEGCELREHLPLACGVRCLTGCLALPRADESDSHCHQIEAPSILKNGSFPALSSGTPRKAGEEIGNKVEKFPGIPCFRKCKSHCNKLCYAQMSPLQQDFWTNVLASRVHQIEKLQKQSRELQQQHAAVDDASAKSTLDDAEALHELDEGIETHRMRIIEEYREAQAINARARTAADTRELRIFKRPEDTV